MLVINVKCLSKTIVNTLSILSTIFIFSDFKIKYKTTINISV